MLSHRPQPMTGLEFGRSDEDGDDESRDSSRNSESNQEDQISSMSAFVDNAERFAKALDAVTIPNNRKSPVEQRADIFKLIENYHQSAKTKVQNLRKSQKSTASSRALRLLDETSSQDSMDLDDADNKPSTTDPSEELRYWEQETQTWDLLRRLLPLRYSNRNSLKSTRREISRLQSCADLWDEFLQSDPAAQERKAILECLQTSADHNRKTIEETIKYFQLKSDRGEIHSIGWLHTKSMLKTNKNVNGWTGPLDPNSADVKEVFVVKNEPIVTQLDPDAATRQDRKVIMEDENAERALGLACYELLRRGKSSSEIREWCSTQTEVWRALSLIAMPLSKDEDPELSSSDPTSLLLWRRTCFALARQGGMNDYERAVYGTLAGDITSVEKICEEWDDFVFAHYNSLLRSQFDAFLLKRCSSDMASSINQSFPSFNAIQFHGDASSASERLVKSLETNPKTAAAAKTPMKALQAAIISNNLVQYMYDLGVALGKRANAKANSLLILDVGNASMNFHDPKFFLPNDHNGMRVATHAYLLVSALDRLQGDELMDPTRRTAQDNIIATYVSTLRLARMTDLMPLYCSMLPEERAFDTLSRNISRVVEPEDRDVILRIMERLGQDIRKFVVFQPNSLLATSPLSDQNTPAFGAFTVFLKSPPTLKYGRPLKPDFFGEEPEMLDDNDESLIQSLEWFLLVEGLWEEFFAAGTAIYKRFLKSFNLHAARALSERVRCAEVFGKKAGLSIPDDTDLNWFSEVYSGAMTGSFEESGLGPDQVMAARSFFEMECLVRALDSMETIASSEGMAQDPTEEVSRDFWNHVGNEVKLIKSFMQPLLSNWLLESAQEDEEFTYLRDAYLPEAIIGYVSVLHFAGTSLSRDNLLECMELASVIAKKDADIAAVLMKAGRMKEIVEGFANCSKALAISGSEKKGPGASSKKMRENGWTRELWSVKR
ncbi:nuclear pore protein 84/107 [Xylariaceae sp. FL0255]|nr:nuclear pore protein 84/107 [Xylariaceae sp. FL0255]